jgi:flagellar hook-associated protein 3 FlgL
MRVTQSLEQSQFVSTINQLESNLSATQNQISTGLSFTTAAQNPVGAGLVTDYNQALTQSQQFVTNSNSAQTSLNTEDSALTQMQTSLQSLRDLALEANNSSESPQDLSAIATQATQIQNTLLSIGNTQDGNGNFIFAGFSTQTQPFALSATGATYSGDQGQRQVQIAPGQTVPVGDNGDLVFNQIKTGNGIFQATPAAGNTGTGVVSTATVADPADYTGGTFSIDFTAPNTYQVLDANNNVVTSGTFTSGQAISFSGVQVTLTGQPAAGDSFSVAPSTNQSIFTTVQNLVNALQQQGTTSAAGEAQLNNSMNVAINNIDQALNQSETVQSSVGARLNTITTQQSMASSQQVQLQESITNLQGLNFASAITSLDQQNTTLSAAMQAFTLTQGLSLFKFIQ